MNAERLHAIVDVLKREITQTQYPTHLEHLTRSLHAAVNDPENANLQEAISSERESLRSILSKAVSDGFSPVWKQEVQEMGIADLLGDSLLKQIESALTVDETPNVVADEITQIHKGVQGLVRAINEAASSLYFFRIGNEQLTPGDFEINFVIPRRKVNNGLEDLGNEFVELKQIIGPFSELAGENRPEVEVRAISSSEFQVFLIAAPPVAASVAYALDRLASVYERIVHIRLMNKELAETDDVPDDVLEPLSSYADGLIQVEIERIATELIAKSDLVDEGRLNELRTDLKLQLNALARRIDQGYNVEVRTGELLRVNDDGEIEALDDSTQEAAETVLESQRSIRYLNSAEKPIPRLEQRDGPEDEKGEED